MNNLSDKAKNFLAQKPTMVGAVAGIRFYEHPVHGDESPLVMITTDGKVKTSGFYEVPDILELGYEVVRD